MFEYIAGGNANSFRKVFPTSNIQFTMRWQVPAVPFFPRYIKNEYQFGFPRCNLKTIPLNIDFQAERSQIPTSLSTTQNSPHSFPDSTLDESETPLPPPQNDWIDSDIPHSYIDIASFDTPESLEKYIIPIEPFYASTFPSCRHLLFFRSEKEVMFHIVEAHIEPTEKRFVCINCAAEFDESEEADQHALSKQNIISPDVLRVS